MNSDDFKQKLIQQIQISFSREKEIHIANDGRCFKTAKEGMIRGGGAVKRRGRGGGGAEEW